MGRDGGGAVDERWVLMIDQEVEVVQANILGEVGQFLFRYVFSAHVPTGVVSWDYVVVSSSHRFLYSSYFKLNNFCINNSPFGT